MMSGHEDPILRRSSHRLRDLVDTDGRRSSGRSSLRPRGPSPSGGGLISRDGSARKRRCCPRNKRPFSNTKRIWRSFRRRWLAPALIVSPALSRGQTLAAFFAATRDRIPSIFGLRPLEKTVLSFSAPFFRLICSLHLRNPPQNMRSKQTLSLESASWGFVPRNYSKIRLNSQRFIK